MELQELQRNWDEFGNTDPLWAILTHPEKRHGKWRLQDFFQTGEREITEVLRHVRSLSISLRTGKALDFGCGVGRLSQALCGHFEQCCGVDIAPSMITLANRYNRHGSRCSYVVNDAADLRIFADNHFNFIYSNMVLQHMQPSYSRKYLEEFVRVLAPGGAIVFQIPSALRQEPMVDSAYRACLRSARPSLRAAPGSSLPTWVHVKNVSDQVWRAVYLGNHWRDVKGRLLVNDDGRALLEAGVKPGQEINVELKVKAPTAPGDYLLELDLVQEFVAWFGDRGSATTIVPVRIAVSPRPLRMLYGLLSGTFIKAAATQTPGPCMEMHHIPREEVVALVQRAGGRVIDVQANISAPEWQSWQYCVTK
jgi:ubiquinone/menaquinone biosynthesis C-methylase UbiE